MKISASVYSDKKRPLKEVVEDLVQHQVDLLHVDCNDDLGVFDDIASIRTWCELPIDLHIITNEPEKYFDLLRKHPVEYVTFQYEDLKKPLQIPKDIQGKKGLAVITPTAVDVFDVEPLRADDALRNTPNLLVTPHLGFVAEPIFAAFAKAVSCS